MCEHHRSAEELIRARGEPVPESIDSSDEAKARESTASAEARKDSERLALVLKSEIGEQWENATRIMSLANARALEPQNIAGIARTMAYAFERWLHPERFSAYASLASRSPLSESTSKEATDVEV